jgi:hypothetical protein
LLVTHNYDLIATHDCKLLFVHLKIFFRVYTKGVGQILHPTPPSNDPWPMRADHIFYSKPDNWLFFKNSTCPKFKRGAPTPITFTRVK